MRLIGAALAFALCVSSAALAQDWPTRPATMLVPYAAGGPVDAVGRIMAAGRRARDAVRAEARRPRPATMLGPYAAGGPVDAVVRIMAAGGRPSDAFGDQPILRT